MSTLLRERERVDVRERPKRRVISDKVRHYDQGRSARWWDWQYRKAGVR